MNTESNLRIERLRADFEQVQSRPFEHFFCPILYSDENVELCRAHIINQAFPNSSPAWTIQRKDVDSFFGSTFEADFVATQYNLKQSLGDTVTNKKLSNLFKAQILLDGKSVDFFIAQGETPKGFTRMEFDNNGEITQFVLKMKPEDVEAASKQIWEVMASKDVRLPAFVSLVKAAHLTLFEMLGYRYVFSVGGRHVGKDILGDFYLQNKKKPKAEVIKNAHIFFREFQNMVRPIRESGIELRGTITDQLVYACLGKDKDLWAIIVFIEVSQSLHAVLLPIFDNEKMVHTYLDFLHNSNENLDVSLCRFQGEHWELDKKVETICWPKGGVLLSDESFA